MFTRSERDSEGHRGTGHRRGEGKGIEEGKRGSRRGERRMLM